MMANPEAAIDVLKMRVDRIDIDIESEKADRLRVNSELLRRIDESDDRTAEKIEELQHDQRKSDRILYMILGGLILIQFVIPLLHKS